MQECFLKYPELYKDYEEDEDEEGELADGRERVALAQNENTVDTSVSERTTSASSNHLTSSSAS